MFKCNKSRLCWDTTNSWPMLLSQTSLKETKVSLLCLAIWTNLRRQRTSGKLEKMMDLKFASGDIMYYMIFTLNKNATSCFEEGISVRQNGHFKWWTGILFKHLRSLAKSIVCNQSVIQLVENTCSHGVMQSMPSPHRQMEHNSFTLSLLLCNVSNIFSWVDMSSGPPLLCELKGKTVVPRTLTNLEKKPLQKREGQRATTP